MSNNEIPNEHYFVVKGTMDKTGNIKFYVDEDTTLARFPEGYVWNGDEWSVPIEGDLVMVEDSLLHTELRKRLNAEVIEYSIDIG
jgi:uncharacterized protein YacL (UPF0231 family)